MKSFAILIRQTLDNFPRYFCSSLRSFALLQVQKGEIGRSWIVGESFAVVRRTELLPQVFVLKSSGSIIFLSFQLLSKPKFSVLEKIKTIGSTYMVAAGLQPGKEGERTVQNSKFLKQTFLGSGIRIYHCSSFQTHREHHYCGILVDFAIQLMTLLENINRDSFQRFQLRAGLNQVWKLNLATTTSTTKTFFLKFYRELLWLEWQAHKNHNMIYGGIRSMLPAEWNPRVIWEKYR